MKVCLRTQEGKYVAADAAIVKVFARIDGADHYMLFGGACPVVAHDTEAGLRAGWKRALTRQEREETDRVIRAMGVELYTVRAL